MCSHLPMLNSPALGFSSAAPFIDDLSNRLHELMAWLDKALPKLLPCERIGLLWLDAPAAELVNVPEGSQVRQGAKQEIKGRVWKVQ